MKKLILIALTLTSSSLFACMGGSYEYSEFTLQGNAIIVKSSDQSERARAIFTPVLGLKFYAGNQAPGSHTYIKVIGQRADQQGIFDTTYAITRKGIYPGAKPNTKVVKVSTSYGGNGLWAKGCGEIEILN